MTNQSFYISVVDFAFEPHKLTIIPGDTIFFHTYGTESKKLIGAVESPELKWGNVWQHKFDKIGVYNISCEGYPNMQCTINVVKLKELKDPYRKLMYTEI